MSNTYVYNNNFIEFEILPDLLARGREGRVGLDIFPEMNVDAAEVRWNQMDSGFGIQQFRGYNNEPGVVKRLDTDTYVYSPGVYGEFQTIPEEELTRRASGTSNATAIPIDDLIIACDTQLVGRQWDRMEWLAWQALQGSVQVAMQGPNGIQAYTDTYAVQTYNSQVPWATAASAMPILDFQNVQQLSVGHSVDLGGRAVAYMNQYTANLMINNSNAADLGGKKSQFGATLNNLPDIANYFGLQNLPKPTVYDMGYQTIAIAGPNTSVSTYNFNKFIPNNIVIVVGMRPGNAPVGRTHITRNVNSPGNMGPYRFVKNPFTGENTSRVVGGQIEVHRGFNGGTTLQYLSAVVVMNVAI